MFKLYTAKIDDLHIVDDSGAAPSSMRTICRQETISANYAENDRFVHIDNSRKLQRKVCLECLGLMIERANSTINNLNIEIDCRKNFLTHVEEKLNEANLKLEEAAKQPEPVAFKEPVIELFEDGKFTDGKSLEDVPRCAIPGCKSEEVRYWIHPEGKPCRYFCGDCPESEIEKLDKFAESIGEEVGAYDPPLWAVEMILHHNEKNTKVWLIKAHNMAHAIQRAAMGDFDMVSEEDPDRVNQADLIPIDIRKANEEEERRFGG